MSAIARLTRSRDFRSSFPRSPEDHRLVVIPVVPDDTVGYAMDRLSDGGGTAVLVLTTGTGVRLASLTPASTERQAVAEEDDTVTEVHRDSRVDMFFDCLEEMGPLVVEQVSARLVDHGPLQLT